jgi:hypothetical protein
MRRPVAAPTSGSVSRRRPWRCTCSASHVRIAETSPARNACAGGRRRPRGAGELLGPRAQEVRLGWRQLPAWPPLLLRLRLRAAGLDALVRRRPQRAHDRPPRPAFPVRTEQGPIIQGTTSSLGVGEGHARSGRWRRPRGWATLVACPRGFGQLAARLAYCEALCHLVAVGHRVLLLSLFRPRDWALLETLSAVLSRRSGLGIGSAGAGVATACGWMLRAARPEGCGPIRGGPR